MTDTNNWLQEVERVLADLHLAETGLDEYLVSLEMADLLRQAVMMVRDAERLDWLERNLFDKHWDGCIGRPAYWRMAGPHRHTLHKMRGNDLREAIDAAM